MSNKVRSLEALASSHGTLRRASTGSCGQSVVEIGLMIPVLIALLVVVSDFARVFYTYIEVGDAARSGAQYGAQNRVTAANNTVMQQTSINAAPDLTGMTATAISFCTCSDGGTHVSCVSSGCVDTIQMYVELTTNLTFKTLFLFPGIPSSIPLKGVAVLQVK